MSTLLNTLAVGRKDGDDAQELLGAYLGTKPDMALNHTITAAPAAPAPSAPAPGMGGGSSRSSGSSNVALPADMGPPIGSGPEYEVFRNGKDALAFFLYKHAALDGLADDGPFWFQIDRDRIIAGNEKHQTVFENLSDEILSVAAARGVIMLVEFENQKASRCTPCYLTDAI